MTLSLSSHFCELLNEGTASVAQGAQNCVQDTEITIHPHPMIERAGGFHYCFRYEFFYFNHLSRLPLGHPSQLVGLRATTTHSLPPHHDLTSQHYHAWASFHCPIQYVPIQQPYPREPGVTKPIGCPTGVILIKSTPRSEFLEGNFIDGLKTSLVPAIGTTRRLLVSQAGSGSIVSPGAHRIQIGSEGCDIAVSQTLFFFWALVLLPWKVADEFSVCSDLGP
jgi:hypothetical protein